MVLGSISADWTIMKDTDKRNLLHSEQDEKAEQSLAEMSPCDAYRLYWKRKKVARSTVLPFTEWLQRNQTRLKE